MKYVIIVLGIIIIVGLGLFLVFYHNRKTPQIILGSNPTYDQAEQFAIQKINADQNIFQKMVITNSKETDTGWIFFYNYKNDVALGNIPLFVGKDGEWHYISNPYDPLLK